MRFYTSATNLRGGMTTAAGNKGGQTVHTRGWHSGIKVISRAEDDIDVFDVYATSGSAGGASDKFLGTLKDGEWAPAVELHFPGVPPVRAAGPVVEEVPAVRTWADGFGIWHAAVDMRVDSANMARQAILDELTAREGPGFDPDSVQVERTGEERGCALYVEVPARP